MLVISVVPQVATILITTGEKKKKLLTKFAII